MCVSTVDLASRLRFAAGAGSVVGIRWGMMRPENLLAYIRGNVTSSTDPSGTITVAPDKRFPQQATCGSAKTLGIIASSYRFTLDQPAPCDGWFFQKVTVWKHQIRCPCEYHDCRPEKRKIAEYWEWFGYGFSTPDYGNGLIKQGEKTWSEKLLWRDDKQLQDKGQATLGDTCGILIYVGEVRFYCRDDLDMKKTRDQGFFPWPFGEAKTRNRNHSWRLSC